MILDVPIGTVVTDENTEEVLADFTKPGDRVTGRERRARRTRKSTFRKAVASSAART